MNNFEKIVKAEKSREYKIDEKDQFTFNILVSIQSQKTRSTKRLFIITATILLTLVMLAQIMYLQSASFNQFAHILEDLLARKPYFIAIVNLGLVAGVLFIRRKRFN